MKKTPKKILAALAIVATISSIIFANKTILQKHKLQEEITTIKQEKEKIDEDLRVCGEDNVQKEEKIMALEGQIEEQKKEIERLKKEITNLKK